MEKTSKKKGRTVTRRAFLRGLGGGAAGAALATRIRGQSAGQAGASLPPALARKTITFTVNGKIVSLDVEPRDTLLEVLREKLRLTGAKKTCDRGECGGCTVLIDGQAAYSCLFPAVRAEGKKIITVEGLAEGETLHPVQQAYIEKDGYQCGYCTPGFIMSTVALLGRTPSPSPADIKAGLSGNLCRCGNYVKIHEAVAAASQKMRKA
ncbi:MAG TPA: (2Fe-2S)-binding protein [Candidatus Aminicenantes bacterium]|jgi:xanthine dehydrogenase YagT iron-sulfur-binding subunit|nr:(2Fe-2S)-binding protein [Candidatus Aminicenantes bacterium]